MRHMVPGIRSRWAAIVVALALLTGTTILATTPGPKGQRPVQAREERVLPPGLERLQAQIERAIAAANGSVGVGLKHLESGVELYVNGDEPYPMASTVKVAVLIELYAKVKAGQLDWNERVEVTPDHRVTGSGQLFVLFDPPGVQLSLHNVANLMMLISDNSATDICISKALKEDINKRLASLGIKGMRVDRTIAELLSRPDPVPGAKPEPPPENEPEALAAALAFQRRQIARWVQIDQTAADPRDQATPRAFISIFEKLWRGEVVDPESSAAMLETMKRCSTGAARIKGLLPARTVVAHKTGSLGGVHDDVGIIYLPDGAGHLAIAVLSKSVRATSEEADRVIAEIARYAYDYFHFTGQAAKTAAQ
ncbi:MAG: serine hydrolase [Vicinamibacterales bacterium]